MKNWPADAPQLPEAATKHTKAGAEAFVRHYIDVINYAWMKPKSGLIPQLSYKGCKFCASVENTTEELVKNGEWYTKTPVKIRSVKPAQKGEMGKWLVGVTITDTTAPIHNQQGKTGGRKAEATDTFYFALKWSDGWRSFGVTK
ncbi:DUF6318 family protein [Kribbia dieselivorans]|uniref:DUF6318 family protein n=1 Tax=Kribbia dieselivorans TaxID=331526 RepID=UPI0008394B19|nr:DUF6318 family protein [Kribbia dieselivorans]